MPIDNIVLEAVRTCAIGMLHNAMHIERDLPSLALPPEIRQRILDVTSSLGNTKHDVISELRRIDELRDMGASESDAIARVPIIMRWLAQDISKVHALVTSLRAAYDTDPDVGPACALVNESATNILRSYAAAFKAFNPEPNDPISSG